MINSRKPIPKYPYIAESYAYVLSIFPVIFLFFMNFSISPGMYSKPNILKYVSLLPFTY